MIKNVIFDVGDVLVHFSWRERMMELGLDGEELERVAQATVFNPEWKEIDRGVKPLDEIIDSFISKVPDHEKEIREFFSDCMLFIRETDYADAWLEGLKKEGYNIYILSNFGIDFFEKIFEAYKCFRHIDGRVVSYEVHQLKPDDDIYLSLLSKYGLNASECVFFDDMPANIEAACRLGIHGIRFTGREAAEQEFRRIVG